MKKLDVLALTEIKQVEWLKNLDSEYLFNARDGDNLGFIVGEMSDQRLNEINSGSPLTKGDTR
ncbi:MAG: hypothetical protein O3A45_04020 [Proteobacteria bacterium]|jgi:hypothetical protein|nr:hypothetical protein [Pseudomonadota bacterium]